MSERDDGPGEGQDARLEALGRRIDTAAGRKVEAPAAPVGKAAGDYGRAFRLSTEFVAGIIAGAGLGWGVDKLLGTSPWGFILCFMLGFGAGLFNVIKAAGVATPKP